MMVIDPIERHLFLEGLLLRYGYDFRQYAEASLNRRLVSLLTRFQTNSLLDLLKMAMNSHDTFKKILPALTINTTEFFRDPLFFKALREEVFPVLETYSKNTIWVAGCSTGEEVLSLAIALDEAGLYPRCTIYGTDINPDVIKVAKEGIYDANHIQLFNKNYAAAGGIKSPSDYYTTGYGLVKFNPRLLDNVVISEHNLVSDSVFLEANLILCRNVLIYFSRELQDRAFDLFARSLVFKGFLGIGSKESLRFSKSASYFDSFNSMQKIYSLKTRSIPQAVQVSS